MIMVQQSDPVICLNCSECVWQLCRIRIGKWEWRGGLLLWRDEGGGNTQSGRTLSLNLHFPSVIAEIYSHKVHTDAADIIIKKGWANKANMHCFKGERENAWSLWGANAFVCVGLSFILIKEGEKCQWDAVLSGLISCSSLCNCCHSYCD